MKNQKGITLIALVVTIVVLLILAGITITYVLGDDGLFGKAQNAEKDNVAGMLRDYMALAKMDAIAEHFDPNSDGTATASAIIANNFPTSKCGSATLGTGDDAPAIGATGITGTATFTINTVTYTVDFTNNTVSY